MTASDDYDDYDENVFIKLKYIRENCILALNCFGNQKCS